ncbi:hypothetical protein ACFXKS_38415 [Streptomyces scopuliridis]|uniref:hypothetical protein n=1 Tax=Streptomyces scopuliridis TaxID=452529 RepID=UPI0036801FED
MRRVARRADGRLPVVQPGAAVFDPGAINVPMAEVRRLAAEEGRDPSRLGMIPRVYPTAAGTAENNVEALVRSEQQAGVEHAFVELMNVARDIDHSLEIVHRVLDLARGT